MVRGLGGDLGGFCGGELLLFRLHKSHDRFAGEVWKALSRETGENPRKGVCGTEDETLGELADVVCSGLFAIQHRTKDNARTASMVMAALEKAAARAAEAGYGWEPSP